MAFARWLSYECARCSQGSRVQPLPSGQLRAAPACSGCGKTMALVADTASCQHGKTFTFSSGKVKCEHCGATLKPRA